MGSTQSLVSRKTIYMVMKIAKRIPKYMQNLLSEDIVIYLREIRVSPHIYDIAIRSVETLYRPKCMRQQFGLINPRALNAMPWQKFDMRCMCYNEVSTLKSL